MWDGVFDQLVVVRDSRVVGQVVAYNADPVSGWTYVGVVTEDACPVGVGIESVGLFLGYLFGRWPFRHRGQARPSGRGVRVAGKLGQLRASTTLAMDRCWGLASVDDWPFGAVGNGRARLASRP